MRTVAALLAYAALSIVLAYVLTLTVLAIAVVVLS